jgi:hypothetical protein
LTFTPKRKTDVKEINTILKAASEGELKGILNYTDLQLVSIDFNGNPASATYDATLTKIVGGQVKVCAWYDNETGFFSKNTGFSSDHFGEKSGKKIICIGNIALSMGFVILQYCPERIILQSSIIMQHQSSLGLQGPLNNVNSYLDFIHTMGDEIDNQQSKRIGLELLEFRNKINNEWWLFGSDVLTHNVADKMAWVLFDFKTTHIEDKFSTFFGPVTFVFSKCPLAIEPINVKFEDNFPIDKRQEFIQKHSLSNQINEKMNKISLIY